MRNRALLLATLLALIAPTLHAGASEDAATLRFLGPTAEELDDGHYRITLDDGRQLETHGPDPSPDPADHGTAMGPGDPERAPICATDYYQHVLYGRPSGSPDRLASVRATIESAIHRMNHVLYEEAAETGSREADYKVKCNAAGQIDIGSFQSGGNAFTTIANAASSAGYNASNADYTIFYDDTYSGVCGVGSLYRDESLSVNNLNNRGGGYAVTYNNCWTGRTPMHENGHNQGAVQENAPYSTGNGFHCYDDYDVMCYTPDGGNKNQYTTGTIKRCTDRMHFDCGHDSYFNLDPAPGSYLASNWNIGSSLNRFITIGGPIVRPPTAAMLTSCAGYTCSFTDHSSDDGTVTAWSWDFGDGTTSTAKDPQRTYALSGTYTVRLTVTDADGDTGTTEQTLVVPNNGDTDPNTPTLTSGVAVWDRNSGQGTWRVHKIVVPPGRHTFAATLDGPNCQAPLFCNPDLDLYVRRGRAPTRTENDCSSTALSNDEACTITRPPPGVYYVGVYTFFALPSPGINLSYVNFRIQASY